jgi:capsule polysaccharide export protein KpsE/RkpR
VSDEGIEFDGGKLALTPENAPQIRAAIQTLRAQLKQARDASQPAVPSIIQLQMRLDALIEEISRRARRILDPNDRTALQELAVCAIHKLTDVSESLESAR